MSLLSAGTSPFDLSLSCLISDDAASSTHWCSAESWLGGAKELKQNVEKALPCLRSWLRESDPCLLGQSKLGSSTDLGRPCSHFLDFQPLKWVRQMVVGFEVELLLTTELSLQWRGMSVSCVGWGRLELLLDQCTSGVLRHTESQNITE